MKRSAAGPIMYKEPAGSHLRHAEPFFFFSRARFSILPGILIIMKNKVFLYSQITPLHNSA